MTDSVTEALRQSLSIEAGALQALVSELDPEVLGRAVELLAEAPLVTTCASGTSGIAATKLAYTLCCIEKPAKFLPPAEAIHGGLGFVQPGSALVMVSRGGKTAELLPVMEGALRRGARLIAVTAAPESPLAQNAELVIPMPVPRESDPLNVMATTSFIVTAAIFDALIAGLIAKTGYTKEQFGLIHPGGAVGARLGTPGN